jgi:hypothetical protein
VNRPIDGISFEGTESSHSSPELINRDILSGASVPNDDEDKTNGDSPAKPILGSGTSPQSELTVCTSGSRLESDCLGWALIVILEQIQTGYTNHDLSTRSDEDEPPQSVIHAPPGFGDFV